MLIFLFYILGKSLVLGFTPDDGTCLKPDRTELAIRTNLLLPFLNAGVEVPIGKHWSVEADWYYPWVWPELLGNRYCLEFRQASLGVRYWFNKGGKERMLGHSIGLSANTAVYDFGVSSYGQDMSGQFVRMEGTQGRSIGGSLDWLFACKVGCKLHLEFCLGLGVAYHRDVEYVQYIEGGPLLRDPRLLENRGWYFGPTKAQINLVVPIGIGSLK